MEQTSKNSINISKIGEWTFLIAIIFLFIPIRHIFPSSSSYQTGAYSDFTSISLWFSDIFLIISAIFTFSPRGMQSRQRANKSAIPNSLFLILIIWLILATFLKKTPISLLNIWFFIKWLELIVAYGTVRRLIAQNPNFPTIILKLLLIFGIFESLLALAQFKLQHSVGLNFIKEPVISASIPGIAKLVANGTTYIRGYGTMPHPNLLSAFLVTAALIALNFLIQQKSLKSKLIYSLSLLILTLGLTVTFSRAGFLAYGIGLIVYFGIQIAKKYHDRGVWIGFSATLISILVALLLFKPFLMTRVTISDSASLQREFYAKIGVQMVEQHLWFGVGVGESVLHMQQYSPIVLAPWQIQPVHNYFLLAAAEMGIPGALILLWIFASHLIKIFKQELTTYNPSAPLGTGLLLTTTLISFFILMMFDHYFYTLQQTQLLLWIILGIAAAEIQKPRQLNWMPDTLEAMKLKNSPQ